MPYGEGAAGIILDDAVAGAADWAKAFRAGKGDKDLDGMEIIHDAIDGEMETS